MPCVGDLLRFGPVEGVVASKGFVWITEGVPKAGFNPWNPVKPTPGVVVTPNIGLGLSEGAGEPRDSVGGGGVGVKVLGGFVFVAGLVVTPKLVVKVLGVVDHAEGPAFACPKGETVDAKDENPPDAVEVEAKLLAGAAAFATTLVGGGEGLFVSLGFTSTSGSSRGRLTVSPFASSFCEFGLETLSCIFFEVDEVPAVPFSRSSSGISEPLSEVGERSPLVGSGPSVCVSSITTVGSPTSAFGCDFWSCQFISRTC